MKKLLLPLIGAALAAAAFAAEPLPPGVDVFTSGVGGYHSYRIPSLAVMPNGSLLAVAEARKYTGEDPGYGKQEIDLVYKISADHGATWSPMKVMEHSGYLWASANPAAFVDRSNGRTWVFYVRARPHRSSDTARAGTDDMSNFARWSADSGATWSQAIDVTASVRDMNSKTWKVSVPGPGGAIQTRTGRLLLAMWRMPFADFTVYSDDHGATWHRTAMVPGDQGGDECKVVELGDGRILFDMRQEKGPTKWLADSSDGGITWHDLRPGVKVSPVATGLARLADPAHPGRGWILWTGPERVKREKLVLRVSADEGRSFPKMKRISDQCAAYSDVQAMPDGSAAVLWERGIKQNYEFITYTPLTKDWLAPVLGQ